MTNIVEDKNCKIIALAGNPNVGKSTVFNQLTGLNQHTGNWPGKTVASAKGYYYFNEEKYVLVDIPGTYSLMAHSTEEEIARNFICFGENSVAADCVVVVCDGTCLERNLNLVLQTIEITSNVVICVNLMDEVKKKKIQIDFKRLERDLRIPVVCANARKGTGLYDLKQAISELINGDEKNSIKIQYSKSIERAISIIEPVIEEKCNGLNPRWVSLRLIENNSSFIKNLNDYLGYSFNNVDEKKAIEEAKNILKSDSISDSDLNDSVVSSLVCTAEDICKNCVTFKKIDYNSNDRKIDKILTSKITGIPVMLLLLALVFWITITGSNYPSELLSRGLFWIQDQLLVFMNYIRVPEWLSSMLILGIFRVLIWVVSVMLPPMAIFFPLFTLLEDFGYLPRVAFNLDNAFKKCCACGKQALTMCMGFGCNAVGVIGCRIIDSPRERLIAIITNNFVPCNGRYPCLIAIISMFLVLGVSGSWQSVFSAILLTLIILLGILMTFAVSKILSNTILKGVPSSFTLELPPYRKPQIGKVIVRSIFDRTLFVLGRAVLIAAPAGLLIWLMANITINDLSVLRHFTHFLDPFAKLIGLDGVILTAFILGFPANEIVFPIIIMAYLSQGNILELANLYELRELLIANGWTLSTAICVMLFSLMHWPCSTTCLTIKKETQSLKWTFISFAVPTITGIGMCFIFTSIVRLIGFK